MYRTTTWLLAAALIAPPVSAGVAYEMAGTDHENGKKRKFTTEVIVEGANLRMRNDLEGGSASEMIYHGTRKEILLVDHDTKTYIVLDKELAGSLDSMIQEGMKEVLAQVPEAQRAEIEKMMKEQLGGGNATERPEIEVRNTKVKAEMNGYACVQHEIVEDGTVIREHCVADWDSVEGAHESTSAFESMAAFYDELLDAIREVGLPMDEEMGNPFDHIDAMGGFPVFTRELDHGGTLSSEWGLVSSARRAFEPGEFEPPSGYERQDMTGGLN